MPALLLNKHSNFTEQILGKWHKHAISMILSRLTSLGGVIIKGLNSYLNHKRNAAMSNAVKQLYENDKIFHDWMLVMQNRTALLAEIYTKLITLGKISTDLIENWIELIGNFMFLWKKQKQPLDEHIQQ